MAGTGVGDGTIEPIRAHAFWSDDTHRTWIEDFRSSDVDVTIFVGAGASMEIGLPSWGGLLESLLATVADDMGLVNDRDAEGRSRFAAAVLKAEGFMGAGEVVRAWLGASFEDRLLDVLYEGRDPRPGPISRGVARLYKQLDGRCEVATLNYDMLLERALVEDGIPVEQVLAAADGNTHAGIKVVRHLHGARPPRDVDVPFPAVGHVVLSERDYLLPETQWQESWVINRLIHTRCVFVGIGMSDFNILRYLYKSTQYRTTASPHHTALLRNDTEDASIREARQSASELRWTQAGVHQIWVDHYVQTAQLLYELEYCLALDGGEAGGYRYYVDRMKEWESAIDTGLLQTDDRDEFVATQDATQQVLEKSVDFIREVLDDDLGGVPDDERFGVHLWVRRFSKRALSLWCSSDRAWRDPSTLSDVPIDSTAQWIAVQAFCQGTPVESEIRTPGAATRWGFVRGIPIFLDDATWGRLPVGVATLASTRGADSSLRSPDLSPQTADEIYWYVHDVAAGLLTPAGAATPAA